MRYCLDTNTCIDAMKGRYPGLAARCAAETPADIVIASMVYAELLHGARRSAHPDRAIPIVERFLAPYAVVPFDQAAAVHYAAIRAYLEERGCPIGPNDVVIAASARSRNLTLVTGNTREFGRVPGLALEDWCRR